MGGEEREGEQGWISEDPGGDEGAWSVKSAT